MSTGIYCVEMGNLGWVMKPRGVEDDPGNGDERVQL